MTGLSARIEALRDAVRAARSMPMSSSVVIHRQEFLDGLDELEAASTAALEESAALVARRDAIFAEAEASAAEIVRQARLEQDRLASDTEVFKLAQRRAEAELEKARIEADALRKDTDTYIEQRLANFEHSLDRTLTEVRRGIANLSGRGAFDDPGASSVGEQPSYSSDEPEDVLLAKPEAG
jgi:hypothetical protein